MQVCRGEIRGATVRDRLAAVTTLFDRGHGKPMQSIDMVMLTGKKLSEMTIVELAELSARVPESAAIGDEDEPQTEGALH